MARVRHPLSELDVRFSRLQLSEPLAPGAGVLRLPEGSPARPCGTDGSMGAGHETASGAWLPARHAARAAGASAAPDCGPPRRSCGRRGDGVRRDTRCPTQGAPDARSASRSSAGPAWTPRAPHRAPGGGAWGQACAPGMHIKLRLSSWTMGGLGVPPSSTPSRRASAVLARRGSVAGCAVRGAARPGTSARCVGPSAGGGNEVALTCTGGAARTGAWPSLRRWKAVSSRFSWTRCPAREGI